MLGLPIIPCCYGNPCLEELGPLRVAILFPDDLDVMQATAEGMKEGLIAPVFVGEKSHIKAIARKTDLPLQEVLKLCFSGQFTQEEINRRLFSQGGGYSYLGTHDIARDGRKKWK